MKKIGILGGTFNPPHIGHLIIANEVRHALGLDEVRLMPTATPPHKASTDDVTTVQRLRMVELAIDGIDGLKVSPFELERGGVSYTYDSMKVLTEQDPMAQFFFIIGGDMIDALPTWYRIDDLVKLVQFVGVNRPGYKGLSEYPVELLDTPQVYLSSSMIRQRFTEGKTVQFLMPKSVEVYIRQEGLYESD
ncbi:nicotinate-nucleotide adenylyltransferase [Sporosarcina sp. FA9]|uniref:nicotinate-nucleotide adenylyltransferase n=1 Tax=Sporosarcina sp. FA9 TaxID=3413030 RepID=UPI003F65AB12